MNDGTRVAGSLVEAAWDGDTRELYVRGATLVDDSSDEPPGGLVLFITAAVPHVYFPERDPNWEAVSSGESPERSRQHGTRLTLVRPVRRAFERVRRRWASDAEAESGVDDALRVDTDEVSPDGVDAVDSDTDTVEPARPDSDPEASESAATEEAFTEETDGEESSSDGSSQT